MIDQTDRSLAKAAIEKMKLGQTPSAREAGALKRVEREQEESRRWQYYRSVPAKHYKDMSGRGSRVLIDQAQRLGVPVAGPTIDLTAVLRWFHDFLARHSLRLAEAQEHGLTGLDGMGGSGSGGARGSKALERYRTAMAEEKEMQVAKAKDQLIPMDEVLEIVGTCCSRLVRCLNLVENSIATEFEIWLNDPEVKAMDSDQRRRRVREFVAKTCAEVRNQEARDLRAQLNQTRESAVLDQETGKRG